jgi:hypothetical protein
MLCSAAPRAARRDQQNRSPAMEFLAMADHNAAIMRPNRVHGNDHFCNRHQILARESP